MNFSSRIKFTFIHFSISLVLVLISVLFVFNVWYEAPLNRALGVDHLFRILIVVDVILGPLLCYIIYNEKKKSLKFDLCIIIVLQIAAFLYGFYIISTGKPAWIVFSSNRFELVTVRNITQNNPNFKFSNIPWLQPKWVAMSGVDDPRQQSADQLLELMGKPAYYSPTRYIEIDISKLVSLNKFYDLNSLSKFNQFDDLKKVLVEYPNANAWLPLIAQEKDMVVLINKDKAEVVKIVDLRPWN